MSSSAMSLPSVWNKHYVVLFWSMENLYQHMIVLKNPGLSWRFRIQELTLKHWETHGCVVSTVATDALVLKLQAISIHNAD